MGVGLNCERYLQETRDKRKNKRAAELREKKAKISNVIGAERGRRSEEHLCLMGLGKEAALGSLLF